MGESLPLSVVRPVSKAHSDAEPARIPVAVANARLGLVSGAVSVAVVTRLSAAALSAVERALSNAVLDAVVVRVLELVSGRVSVADVALLCGERKKRRFAESTLSRHGRSFTSFRMTDGEGFSMTAGEGLSMTSNPCHSERSEESSVWRRPRKHVLRPTRGTISHESTKPTKGKMRVGQTPHRAQFPGPERELRA